MAQTLKFGKGTWATKTGSSMAYNDQNGNYKPLPFNVERDSIATRVNKQGLIEVVGKDKLRIDYTDSAKGVALLENSATNLITYSEDFSQWTSQSVGTGSAPIITSNSTISPDGTQNADKVVFDKGVGNTTADLSIIASNSFTSQTNTVSFYIKADSPQKIVVRNSSNWQLVDVTTEWQRISKTDTGSSVQIGLRDGYGISGVPDTATIYLWGVQSEAQSYATSYIPTSGSTVTRQADVVNGSGNSEVFNDSEGVLFANIAALADDGVNKFISISDGTISNRINIVFDTSNNINARQAPGGVNISTSGINILNSNKIAYEYQSGSQELWVNGFKIGETSVSTLPSGLDRLSFDSFNGGDNMYCKTKEIAYYNEILTDLELETLTSYRSLNELVTELNLKAL